MQINGKQLAKTILDDIKGEVAPLKRAPHLVFILVGDHGPSLTYVSLKNRRCEYVGMKSTIRHLPESTSQQELTELIEAYNGDANVDGILVQQPLPSHIDNYAILSAIDPKKDVDGFHPINMGKLVIGDSSGFIPCTPLGVLRLLQESGIEIAGKEVVIVGRSTIVGKPLAALLLNHNATVTIAHSHTKNLAEITRCADILCVAIGNPGTITADMIKKGAAVIDIGITKTGELLVGDVDQKSAAQKCAYITPVPGGVGPMTIAMLLSNTLLAYKRR